MQKDASKEEKQNPKTVCGTRPKVWRLVKSGGWSMLSNGVQWRRKNSEREVLVCGLRIIEEKAKLDFGVATLRANSSDWLGLKRRTISSNETKVRGAN